MSPGRPRTRAGAGLVAVLVALAATTALAACGGGEEATTTATASRPATTAATHPEAPAAPAPHHAQAATDSVAPSHCPPGLPSCRVTVGRIVYVERVDPDGDGDAHFVIADPQGITLPGLTAIDVRAGLRPHPLPGPGDLVSAAGPVQTGSYGQSQIHALELHVGG
jgi:hypothetical protein